MKKKMVLLAGILAVGMCASSAVCADENTGSGIMNGILSETLDKLSPETETDTEAFGLETEAE